MQKRLLLFITIAFLSIPQIYSQAPAKKMTRQDYIQKYGDLAQKEMKRSGVPASITLAQGLLESGNGNSMLSRKANNHFGIKCHSSWTGKKVFHDDDKKNECFRKYHSVFDSYRDHSDFLKNSKRYASLFALKITDYKGWAKGLKKAGYATNPKYPSLLIKIIEDNKLYTFDSSKKIKTPKKNKKEPKSKNIKLADVDNYSVNPYGREVQSLNRINYIVIKDSDTFYSISKEFDMMLWQLYKYNDLPKGSSLKKGQKLYLQPKRSKAERKHNSHMVKDGETMYTISQKYGVKLKTLYSKNNMKSGDRVKAGQTIWLRQRKPVN